MRKFILHTIILLALSLQLHVAIGSNYLFRNIAEINGLNDGTVSTIYKDPFGLVWLGTATSLESFDGTHISHYEIPGDNPARKRVYDILSTDDRILWIGNGDGLWTLDSEANQLTAYEPKQLPYAVHALAKSEDGRLYIGTSHGLYIREADTLRRVLINPNELAPHNRITDIDIDHDGLLWIASAQGIHSYHPASGKITSYHLPDADSFSCLKVIGRKVFTGSLTTGLHCFDQETGLFSSLPEIPCSVINALAKEEANLYVGTDGDGLFILDTETSNVQQLTRRGNNDMGLTSNAVYSLLPTRDQLFVGFYQNGLDYSVAHTDEMKVYYADDFSTHGMPIRALAIHGSEKLIGSRQGLYFVDEVTGRKCHFGADDLHCQMIFSIVYHQGEYYVGTFGGGLYVFNSRSMTLRRFSPDRTFDKKIIFCLTEDPQGMLWVATEDAVFRYKNGHEQIGFFNGDNSILPKENIYEIFFDSTGRGWICTEQGFYLWDSFSNSLRSDVFPEGFFNREKVRVVYEDANHNLYFAPDKGLPWTCDLSLLNFRQMDELPQGASDVAFIVEDKTHGLWFGTHKHLFKYIEGSFTSYDYADGLPGMIFSRCKPVLEESGRLWFGNDKGLVYTDPGTAFYQPAKFAPRITSLLVNGEARPLSIVGQELEPKIKLHDGPGTMTLNLSDFSYTDPSCMQFEYRMDGVDEQWQLLTGKTDVSYYNLRWGNYTFHVRRPGEESEAVLHISVAITISDILIYVGIVALVLVCAWLLTWIIRHRKYVMRLYHILTVMSTNRRLSRLAKEAKEAEAEAVAEEKAEEKAEQMEEEALAELSSEKYKSYNMSAENREYLVLGLTRLMTEEKLYTRQDLKASDVAEALDVSPYVLSYLFNQVLNIKYNDYINEQRIAEFKRLVRKPENSRYTLLALAERCGFSSRASFFRYFKKATGITPNEYIRSLEVSNS